ncbi:hypothetical protein [Porphyrobacter sp. GA68]|uniref:hypothetical protein n=1 Tax=Porphyrobacter sp. GA68 TaxID=2883480 RepID=UPI001D17F65E|nr:hypothetical protein [Porphyrobacter sp. GA68]
MASPTFRPQGSLARWRLVYAVLAGAILTAPLFAMQFTTEVNWTTFDFMAAAVLLGLLWTGIEVVARLPLRIAGRAAITGCLVVGFLVLWAEGAVGVF